MKSTLTVQQQNAISEFLKGKHIPSGIGTKDEACSIAAINLALDGNLSDTIPDCMSRVIGQWIIGVQDAMPDTMRNSSEWRTLLPLAAGTGRNVEKEALRLEAILTWMWDVTLPSVQPIADKSGFGRQWVSMCTVRTYAAADAAADAADAAYAAADAAAYAAAEAAYAWLLLPRMLRMLLRMLRMLRMLLRMLLRRLRMLGYCCHACCVCCCVCCCGGCVCLATAATHAAYAAAYAAAGAATWEKFDPIGLLTRLIEF